MATGMFGNTKHVTQRLISAADAACILRFELAAPLPIFKAANLATAFLKISGAALTKTTRLVNLRADAARDAERGFVKTVNERLNSAFPSKPAGGDGSTAA
jgi:hypothetical protein